MKKYMILPFGQLLIEELEEKNCPVCHGQFSVVEIGIKEDILLDESDSCDCPACEEGSIFVNANKTENELKKLDDAIIQKFKNFIAI